MLHAFLIYSIPIEWYHRNECKLISVIPLRTVRESKKLLTITLKNKVKVSEREGKELLLYFDASLEITNVTQKIFGANKYRVSQTLFNKHLFS